MKREGFTVVELMIVLAVLVVLAALLIPRFQDVIKRRKAAKIVATCQHIAEAIARLNDDCGVIPAEGTLDVLWDKNSNNYQPTGIIKLDQCWDGPYFTYSPPSGATSGGTTVVGIPTAASEIKFHYSTSDENGDGVPKEMWIQITNVPSDVALFIERKVDGPASDLNTTGKWVCQGGGGGGGAFATVNCEFLIYETM